MIKRKTHDLLQDFPLILSEIQSSEVQQGQRKNTSNNMLMQGI